MNLGDVFILGNHKLMYGDSTNERHVEKLFDGERPALLLTDPPYSCGGFSDLDRDRGSMGGVAQRKKGILNDKLSSRGYQSLIKRVLDLTPCAFSYIFTDWRMWVYLFDVVESSGFNVRSQIVWDKMSYGMGQGWRPRHEMIMFGRKVPYKFDGKKAKGNVIACKRSGNKHHTTEKPLELIKTLLSVFSDDVTTVYDPFAGSGTTLLAAEEMGLRSWNMEKDERYVKVAIERYNKMKVASE